MAGQCAMSRSVAEAALCFQTLMISSRSKICAHVQTDTANPRIRYLAVPLPADKVSRYLECLHCS
jgi:hypothetical protein